MSATRLGRRLPEGSRFATVEELFKLDDDERATTAVWLGGADKFAGWMALDALLDPKSGGGHRASLVAAPSSLVVVVRPW